jgi:hypothetical protein
MTKRPLRCGSIYNSGNSGASSKDTVVIWERIPYLSTTFNISTTWDLLATKEPLIVFSWKTMSKESNWIGFFGSPRLTIIPRVLKALVLHRMAGMSSVQTIIAARPPFPAQDLILLAASLSLKSTTKSACNVRPWASSRPSGRLSTATTR